MKRSSRLILLIGIFLAIVAFVAIILIFQQGGTTSPTEPVVRDLPTVFASQDIPLGATITQDVLRVENRPETTRDATAFSDPSLLLGRIARQNIPQGKQLTASDFDPSGMAATVQVPVGRRAIAVQVDRISGVGALIRAGDYVDVVVAVTGDKMPLVLPDTITPVDPLAYTETTTKVLVQGAQVVQHILPPAPAPAEGEEAPAEPVPDQEIVILSVSAQQAEVIKFAQLDGSISLVLRSPDDFRDPTTGDPLLPPDEITTGITLRVLIDEYGVLVPGVVEAAVGPNVVPPTPRPTPEPTPTPEPEASPEVSPAP